MKIIYFIYFILTSKYKQVFASLCCLKDEYNIYYLIFDAFKCAYKYGSSIDDYFNFRFYQKKDEERYEIATTSFMYNFHKSLNDKRFVKYIDDKSLFRLYFSNFTINSELFSINDEVLFNEWNDKNTSDEFVIKNPLGETGKSVFFFKFIHDKHKILYKEKELNYIQFFKKFSHNNILYIEPRIVQNEKISTLSPSAVNTIRVITIIDKYGEPNIIAAAFRIALDNNRTDNFSTGNLAATVNIENGIVVTPGIKRMASCSESFILHPNTNVRILGFKIPLWDEVVNVVKEAAKVFPQVRTVGWDVAILDNRPIIIEGNTNWNKGAPQIPNNKGIRPLLQKYLNNEL